MKATIKTKEFTAAVVAAMAVTERKVTIPILGTVRLEVVAGQLEVKATNLEMAYRGTIRAESTEPGRCCVPASKLRDILRGANGETVTISLAKRMSVSCGSFKAAIATDMMVESFPDFPEADGEHFEIHANILAKMCRQSAFCISSEESRFTLKGALFEISDGTLRVVATDGHRMSVCEQSVPGAKPGRSVIVPKQALKVIEDECSQVEIVRVGRSQENVWFDFGNRLLISRLLAGSFPSYEKVLPKHHPNKVSVSVAGLRQATTAAMVFADERSRCVSYHFENGNSRAKTTSDSGESEASFEATGDVAPLDIAFSGEYVVEALSATGQEDVTIRYKDSASVVEISTDGFRHVIMPMRL